MLCLGLRNISFANYLIWRPLRWVRKIVLAGTVLKVTRSRARKRRHIRSRFHSVLSMLALQASTNINIGYIAHGTHHYEIHGRILISFHCLVFTSLYFWSCCRGFVSRDRGETGRQDPRPRRDRGVQAHGRGETEARRRTVSRRPRDRGVETEATSLLISTK